MDDKRILLLRDGKISKAINHMSLPAILGMMIMAIYNVVDTVFVAWLGTAATGATQVVMPIMMLTSSIGLTFGIGGGSYVSRLLGMKRRDEADTVATVAFFSSLTIGLIYTVLTLMFLEPLLGFFGAAEDVMILSSSYGKYILLGSIFTMGSMTLNNLLRSEGSAKLSMIGMGTGAILNIILDPIFIFVFDMGIEGAAIATTLSQFVGFMILLTRYLGNHTVLKIHVSHLKPSLTVYKEIFKVGTPTFIRQVLFSMSIGLLNTGAVNYGGSDLLAAVGIVSKLSMIPMYIVFGIGQGFQPVAGYNYGAGNVERVMGALKYSLSLALLVTASSGLVFILFSDAVLGIFRATEAVTTYGKFGIKCMAVASVLVAISNTISIFYQALGKGKESLILSVARQGVFLIPLIIILPLYFGTYAILAAQLSADILSVILSCLMFIPFIRSGNLKKEFVSDAA